MNLADDDQRGSWRARLGAMFAGRPVICGPGPLAGYVDFVALTQVAGARSPLVLATARGAGPAPPDGTFEMVRINAPAAASMTEELRAHDRLVRELPPHVVARIEAYDGRREAFWFGGPFLLDEPIHGRQVIGGRPRSWVALEDKLVVDALWDEVDAPHADHEIVRCDLDSLRAAVARQDRGDGAVLAGDARDGFNGGGDFVRWVLTEDDLREAFAFFVTRCDRLRVMPFLEGVPCSIHGFVLPDGTAVFRPVELAILRGPGRRFVYGGQGTSWSPDPADREQMRGLARRTGEWLRTHHDYRGGFGIDGVLTRDGFRPTELNPRVSGGLAALARILDAAAVTLLQLNLQLGRDPLVTCDELEAWALPVLDQRPFRKVIAVSPDRVVDEEVQFPVTWTGDRLERAEASPWSVQAAGNPSGTYARLAFGDDPSEQPDGSDRIAGLNAALMRFLDAELGTSFGDVHPAPDVRTVP